MRQWASLFRISLSASVSFFMRQHDWIGSLRLDSLHPGDCSMIPRHVMKLFRSSSSASAILSIVILAVSPLHAADPISLRAGPLTMLFEPDHAFLRYVKIGPHEVLRGINAPIRNELWGTVKPVVTNLQHEAHEDHFTLIFDALCQERDIDFRWRGKIQGNAKGEIEFTFDGEARSTFKRNRIGFCVLHPASAGGKPWVIENVRGEKSKGAFPKFISPHQPAHEIREIGHELAPGLWAHVRMEGDTFEMEDQRNWTDASFKTYCTPLEIPYPVLLEQGSNVSQKISIRVEGDLAKYSGWEGTAQEGITLTLTDKRTPLPRIGLKVSSEIDSLSDKEAERLRKLRLDHLRVDLIPAGAEFEAKFRAAHKQANSLGVTLHLGLRLGENPKADLKRVRDLASEIRPQVSTWFIIGADEVRFQLAKSALSDVSPGALFGAPRDGISFVELNRERPYKEIEVVAYHMTPQIHASDNASIVETLPIQGDTVRSARQFIGDKPLVISPITFHTLLPGLDPQPGELPWNVDVRQTSPFAAAWTVGSLKFLAEAGVQAVTYYETVGWRGIMDVANPPDRPDKFPSKRGAVYPIYEVLARIAEFRGGEVVEMTSSDTLSVVGLALSKGTIREALIANLTDRPQLARLLGSESVALAPHQIQRVTLP